MPHHVGRCSTVMPYHSSAIAPQIFVELTWSEIIVAEESLHRRGRSIQCHPLMPQREERLKTNRIKYRNLLFYLFCVGVKLGFSLEGKNIRTTERFC